MRRLLLIPVVMLAAGCGGGCGSEPGERTGTARTSAKPGAVVEPGTPRTPAKSGAVVEPGTPPAADVRLPASADGLAAALVSDTRELESRIRAWQRSGPGEGARPPAEVTLYALFQQRIYRHLRRHPALAEGVVAAMPAALRSHARDNIAAGRSLLRLMPKKPPKTQPRIRVGTAEPPGRLLAWYRQAQRRFGVRWQILASVNFVESGFNRLRNNSYAGAQGPMQFIPSTWSAYGLGGNIRDPRDAIMGAANYLRASGAPGSYRRAIYSYNPSPLYVDAIIRYARQMQRKPERFYAYWSWQVFVRTKTGEDKRLTGPGV